MRCQGPYEDGRRLRVGVRVAVRRLHRVEHEQAAALHAQVVQQQPCAGAHTTLRPLLLLLEPGRMAFAASSAGDSCRMPHTQSLTMSRHAKSGRRQHRTWCLAVEATTNAVSILQHTVRACTISREEPAHALRRAACFSQCHRGLRALCGPLPAALPAHACRDSGGCAAAPLAPPSSNCADILWKSGSAAKVGSASLARSASASSSVAAGSAAAAAAARRRGLPPPSPSAALPPASLPPSPASASAPAERHCVKSCSGGFQPAKGHHGVALRLLPAGRLDALLCCS